MGAKNPAYGELNPIDIPIVQDRIDLQDGDPLSVVRVASQKAFTPDALANTGPYKAILLKVENYSDKGVGDWVNSFYNYVVGPKENIKLHRVRARIPEIHAMLPIPENYTDHAIIEMYPTFIARSTTTESPGSPGDLIWVDFGNKTNFTDPIYLGPVKGTAPGGAGTETPSASGAHAGACTDSYNSSGPGGDTMSGMNRALSHSGLPLLPRKPKSVATGENKILKGLRFSQTIVQQWESAVKKQKLTGTTWIGTTNSNGMVDPKHPSGKRSTIIFAPSTTDFSLPVEIIYFFHGYGGFSDNKEFSQRIIPKSKALAEAGRNFVIVVPEMPWTHVTYKKYKSKSGSPWVGRDDFGKFHFEVAELLKASFSSKLNVGYISVIGFSAGGKSLYNAAKRGFNNIKPNKITFADASYASSWLDMVWAYVSKNPEVEFNILTSKKANQTNAQAEKFFNETKALTKDSVSHQKLAYSHRGVGTASLLYNNPKVAAKSASATKASQAAPQPDPATQESPFIQPPVSFGSVLPQQPVAPPPMSAANAKTAPSIKPKQSDGSGQKKKVQEGVVLAKARPFSEARVYVSDYGQLDRNAEVLVNVPSSGPQRKAHKLVVKRFLAMSEAWVKDTGNKPLLAASAWRPRRWPTKEAYEDAAVKKYAYKVPGGTRQQILKEARKWLAHVSPHETGLAIDIGNNGLSPNSRTNAAQKQSECYKWLVANAHKFGFTPYKHEAWHWECRLPKESWASGEEFTDDYATLVVKAGKGGSVPKAGPASRGSCVSTLRSTK